MQLLRLRFNEGLPIRDIARVWGADASAVHHEYATAREEFRAALRETVAFHSPGATPEEIDCTCGALLGILAG